MFNNQFKLSITFLYVFGKSDLTYKNLRMNLHEVTLKTCFIGGVTFD